MFDTELFQLVVVDVVRKFDTGKVFPLKCVGQGGKNLQRRQGLAKSGSDVVKNKQFSIYQMNQRGIAVTFETMDWLHNREMVFRYEDEEMFSYAYEEPEYLYQINAGGRSELRRQQHFEETEKRAQNAEIRAQKAEVRARISLVVSIIAVIVAWLK